MSSQLNVINATIRELINSIENLRKGKIDRDQVLRLIDELENQIDNMVYQFAPERITDERFSIATNSLREISKNFKLLREHILSGRYIRAKRQVLDLQESVRQMYRILMLIRAGAPTTLIFQVTPQFLRNVELPAPEALIHSNPMAAQIYNILQRKGEASIEELATELRIDNRTRDEFNRAVAYLISTGFARPYLTQDNRMVLRPAGR